MTSATADTWDVIVIGAGPPGENVADYAGRDGLTTVLVESELVGGECSYWACMPSKAMLRPAELFGAARVMPGLKEAAAPLTLDVAAVLDRRDSFTSHHDDSGQVAWAEGAGIGVVRGHGRLSGEKTVEVTAPDGAVRTLTARHAVVLATGTRAAVPPIPGLREAQPWTSRDVTNLHEVPEAVVVIGGGVVACESVTWLRALGCRTVTLVEAAQRLLGRTEPFAGELVAESLRDAGVILRLGKTVTAAERGELVEAREGYRHGGPVTVTLDDGTTITADEVLVAAGRVPNSDDIGLETVGVSANAHGYLDVDGHMGIPATGWLYAIGDLCGKALLTHMGKYQARVAGDVIAARAAGRALDDERFVDRADEAAVPQVIFTEPEVGSVGLTVAEARVRGIDIETVEYDLGRVAGASLLRDGYAGRANLVIDRRRDVVIGATFVGSGVAELVHSATVAIIGEVPMPRLWHAVPSYPTVSEVWLRLLETLRQQREAA